MAAVDTTIEQLSEITSYTGLADGDSIPIYDTSETSAEPTKRVELDTLTDYLNNNITALKPFTTTSKASDYTITESDTETFFLNYSGVGNVYTLPTISSLSANVTYGITNQTASYCVIKCDVTNTLYTDVRFDNGTAVYIAPQESAIIHSILGSTAWVVRPTRSPIFRIKEIATDYNINSADKAGILLPGSLIATHTSGTVTITVPPANSTYGTAILYIKYVGTGGTLTVSAPNVSSYIDGNASLSTTVQNSSISIQKMSGSVTQYNIISQTGTWT
jgi:hypothetical protein